MQTSSRQMLKITAIDYNIKGGYKMEYRDHNWDLSHDINGITWDRPRKKNRGHKQHHYHLRPGSIIEGIIFGLVLIAMPYILFFLMI